MNNKFLGKAKRLLSGVLAAAMAVTMLPAIPAFAATGATTYSYDGYDVQYAIVNEWDNGQTIEVTVTNTGDDSILNWAFKYDAEGEISNLWNATVVENQDTEYVIKNSNWNYEIAPNQSVIFGYTLTDDDFDTPDKFELCSKRVDVFEGYDVQMNITNSWDVGVQGELIITNTSDAPIEAWTLSFDTNFVINDLWDGRILENTDNHYTIASEMWTNPIPVGGSTTVGFTGTKTAETEVSISNYLLKAVVIDRLEIDWEDKTDTDNDGLPDVYEIHAYNTDPKNPDTDGDNLPDGYEVITLRTEPTLVDTDGNGTTDDLEDFDSDGLTNHQEYLLGTNPYKADSDEDGLSDGDEVNTYGTNPLKPDTDDDGVLDGDEILLGLNPNDSSDGNTPVKQVINEEEMRVNKYNDDFKISIDVDANNNVKRFIKQGVSRYSGILSDNKSIVGVPINIEYNAGTIVSGTIKFNLDNEFINNNPHYYPEMNLGIDRYGVFFYDKVVGTIVPVPCDYDEKSGSIIIDAKYMGNLMIVDYESLMFDLGIEPETHAEDIPMVMSFAADESEFTDEALLNDNGTDDSANELVDYEDISLEEIESIINGDEYIESNSVAAFSLFSDEASVKSSSAMRQVDLVLVVDTTGSMGSQIAAVKTNLSTLISKLRDDGISLYVSVVDYRDITCDGVNSTKVNNNSGVDFNNSVSSIANAISSLYPDGGGDGPETAIDGLGAAYYLDYRNSAAKFAFLITDATYKNNNNYRISNMTEMAEKLKSKGISTSVVTYPSIYNTYEGLATFTGGELISMYGDFCNDMYEVIYNKTPESSVVIANNIVTGFFKEELRYGGSCDTDGDTLSDSSEVDWDNVKKVYDDGSYSLYTWKELCEKSWIWPSDYDDGKDNPLFDAMSGVYVIPAFSNPFSADTDKDYYPDNIDDDKLDTNSMYIYDAGIDDSDFHKGVSVTVKESDKYTDGKLTVDNNAGTAKYTFARRSNDFAYFTLKPNATSFYKLTSKANLTSYITVTYEKGVLLWKETVEVYPEDDGTYLLEQGKEYTIEVYGYSSSEFDFTVEQDNWVYAPDGGIWEVTEYSNSSAITSTLCYERIYMPSHRIVSSIIQLTDGAVCIQIDPTGNVEAQLESVLRNTGMQVTQSDIDGAITTITGAAATTAVTIIAILVPEPASTAAGAAQVGKFVIGLIANGCTYWGVPSAIQTLNDYMEQCGFERAFTEGNANVMAAKYISIGLGNVWDPWTSSPYINKISNMGDIGKVDKTISDQEIIDWCGWELES